MTAKKAPKEPKRPEKPPPPPTTVLEEFWRGFVGRGIRPFSLWFYCIFVPVALVQVFDLASMISSEYSGYINSLCVFVAVWTVPFERVANFLLGLGNLRDCLADVVPHLPGLVPYLPGMLPHILPNLWQIAPAVGPLAPYLKFLITRPKFLAKALPLLVPRMELMLKYNVIDLLGANFERMEDLHYEKLEMILPDLMRDLPVLAPHFHIIAPYIVEIAERADVLFPVVPLLLPHIDECKQHLWWLVPFADVPGFQEFLVYLDELVGSIDEFAVYGPDLLPFIPKIRSQIPILVENLDTLLPLMGAAVDHMDPLVYWLSAYMPVANRFGLLNKPMLLNCSVPALGLLPSVPERYRTFVPPKEPCDASLVGFSFPVVRRCRHSNVHYYVLALDGKYVGELRFSVLFALHQQVVLGKLKDHAPQFPEKESWLLWGGKCNVEQRRMALEKYFRLVMHNSTVVQSHEFKLFCETRLPENLQAVLIT